MFNPYRNPKKKLKPDYDPQKEVRLSEEIWILNQLLSLFQDIWQAVRWVIACVISLPKKFHLPLSAIVLISGTVLIILRLLFPPKYVIIGGAALKYNTEKSTYLYPIADIQTALAHVLIIAIVTGLIFYITKRKGL